MKRQIFTILMVLALTMVAGAVFAQSSQNTTAPGPTIQKEPGLTNNNLPNPGNPIPAPTTQQQQPVQEQGTATTGTMQNKPEEGMDVDVDTGANAAGAVDVDVNRTSDPDTDASGIDETGSMDNDAQSGTYSGDTDALPQTASELPTLALFGLLALFGAVAVRRVRNA
ncbi:MAG TPA: hypothetical protein VF789_04400 [Thermoanaerobaculia bacterium]